MFIKDMREVGFPQTHYYGGKLRNAITVSQPDSTRFYLLSFLAHGTEYPLSYNSLQFIERASDKMQTEDISTRVFVLLGS